MTTYTVTVDHDAAYALLDGLEARLVTLRRLIAEYEAEGINPAELCREEWAITDVVNQLADEGFTDYRGDAP